jgi:adenine-specific DNA-methyltransferase
MGKSSIALSDSIVQSMVDHIFESPPTPDDRILYLGDIPSFIDAVVGYCNQHSISHPSGVGVSSDQTLISELREEYSEAGIQFFQLDFLTADLGSFDYVIGNPPALRRENLTSEQRAAYKEEYRAARGHFYIGSLFLEQALVHTSNGGRLMFCLSDRLKTAESDRTLRQWIATNYHVESVDNYQSDEPRSLIGISIINEPPGPTHTSSGTVRLPTDGSEWASVLQGVSAPVESDRTLADVSRQIGAGISTGADRVFMMDREEVPPQLEEFAYPVVAGKHLSGYDDVDSSQVVLCPYTEDGQLRSEQDLGDAFLTWAETHRTTLENRSSLAASQPWYAWTYPPNLDVILQPKILTRDFADEIKFWVDDSGEYIPRKTVFYIVPEPDISTATLAGYLNRSDIQDVLEAKTGGKSGRGYRMKVRNLRELPVPDELE